jgi:hypothetical protein
MPCSWDHLNRRPPWTWDTAGEIDDVDEAGRLGLPFGQILRVHDAHMEDTKMIGSLRFPRSLFAAMAISTLGLVAIGSQPAAAVVVCKTAGVPQGCVVAAPAATAAVVAAPVVGRGVVVRPTVVGRGVRVTRRRL